MMRVLVWPMNVEPFGPFGPTKDDACPRLARPRLAHKPRRKLVRVLVWTSRLAHMAHKPRRKLVRVLVWTLDSRLDSRRKLVRVLVWPINPGENWCVSSFGLLTHLSCKHRRRFARVLVLLVLGAAFADGNGACPRLAPVWTSRLAHMAHKRRRKLVRVLVWPIWPINPGENWCVSSFGLDPWVSSFGPLVWTWTSFGP